MKNKGYAKFWGSNKVHNGRCASSEYDEFVKAAWPSGESAGPAVWRLRVQVPS